MATLSRAAPVAFPFMNKRIVGILLLMFVVGVLTYEALALVRARATTNLRFSRYQGSPVSPMRLTEAQLQMLLKAQDPDFRSHRGIAWPNPLGTTTISQDLASWLYLYPFKPGIRSLEQTLIARFAIEPSIPKERQLSTYIDIAYFGIRRGEELWGFRVASASLFGRPLESLNTDEFLSLVAMLPDPDRLALGTPQHAERLARIKRLVAGQCQRQGQADVMLKECAAQR